MLRGGSWNNTHHDCRAANRNRNEPDNRNNNVGFRVCFAPHIAPVGHSANRGAPRASAPGRPAPFSRACASASLRAGARSRRRWC
ncbi:MAG: hypothetical protein KDH17_18070 [Rhodocyclaceae bacterium]|nr:hypothetical protein [Rhodocyclaceae bacterium]